jgi:division protein CdvB (Snf7/Vps24/ESCRT-III family)
MKKWNGGTGPGPKSQPSDGANLESYRLPIEKIQQSLTKLRVQIEKLDHVYRGLKERDKQCFQVCIEAISSKDKEKAKIYADEVVEIRKMAKKVLHSQLVLEQVKIRLETLEEVGDVVFELLPFTSVINEIRGQLSGFLPDAAASLDELNVHIGSIIAATATPESADQSLATEIDEEARRILEEASNAAAAKVSESFPDLPSIGSEELVYEYAKASPETFDISACAKALGMSEEEVRQALRSLQSKGLIVLEKKERELE